jgi:hypothetical protein
MIRWMTRPLSSIELTDDGQLLHFGDPRQERSRKATVSHESFLVAIVVVVVLAVSVTTAVLSVAPTISRLLHLFGS